MNARRPDDHRSPPALAEWVLGRIVPPGEVGRTILGDTREEYADYRRSGRRLPSAIWYWMHVLALAARLGPARLRRRTRPPAFARRRRSPLPSAPVADAIRGLRRHPGYAALAIVTLAVGMGGVTAMLSVTHDVLLAPLPYDDDAEIVVLWNNGKTARPTFDIRWPVSFAQVEEFERTTRHARASTWMARRGEGSFDIGDVLESVPVGETAWNFFSFLGVHAPLGRVFTADDAALGGAVVVLSDAAWRTRFGADPDVLGRTVTLDGQPRTILGVLPPAFRWFLRDDGQSIEFWIPPKEEPASFYAYWLLARPALSASVEDLRLEFAPIAWEYFTNPGYKDAFTIAEAATADRLREYVLGDVAGRIPFLLGAVALVLLLASLSVAHLLLSRVAVREGELALRRALGASAARVTTLVILESVTLVMLGAGLGVVFAEWGLGLVRAGAPAGVPRLDTTAIDPTTLLGVTAVTGIVLVLVSAIPGWFVAGVDPAGVVVRRGRGMRARTAQTRRVMIGSQVAAAVFLLHASALVLQSWHALVTEDLGFETAGILTGQLKIPLDRFEVAPVDARSADRGTSRVLYQGTDRLFADLDRFTAELSAIAGVEGVAFARHVPLSGSYGWWSPLTIEGWEDRTWEELHHGTSANWVDPDYFSVLWVTPTRGRLLTGDDAALGAAPVSVVSEQFASQFWPGDDAIGKRFYAFGVTQGPDGELQTGRHLVEVVGIVPTMREQLLQESNATVFLPFRGPLRLTTRPERAVAFLLRTSVNPVSIAPQARAVAARIFRSEPVTDLQPFGAIAGSWLREPAFFTFLLALFGGYGLLLALVGIAGVVAFQVARRANEVGIRMALGAGRHAILGLFLRELVAVVTVGAGAGLVAAGVFSRFLESLLYEVGRLDPGTLVVVPIIFLSAALGAAWLPARRALTLDPIRSLRAE